MFLTALFAALAADVPTLDEVRADYPYALRMEGEGTDLRLVDVRGNVVPTGDALVLVGRPEDAERWKAAKTTRNLTSIGLWVTGGLLLAGTSAITDDMDDSAAPGVVAALGAATVGSGFVVRFVVPKKHLGAWVDQETVATALAATPMAMAPESAVTLYERQRIELGEDGVLYDARGRKVKMATLAKLLDLGPVEEEYRTVRKTDKAVWISVTAASGGLFVGGGAASFVGFFIAVLGGPPDLLQAGLASMGLGVVGAGAGVTGLVVSRAVHENPAYWYDTGGLNSLSNQRDRDLRQQLGLPTVRIQPVISPNWVGLAGTF